MRPCWTFWGLHNNPAQQACPHIVQRKHGCGREDLNPNRPTTRSVRIASDMSRGCEQRSKAGPGSGWVPAGHSAPSRSTCGRCAGYPVSSPPATPRSATPPAWTAPCSSTTCPGWLARASPDTAKATTWFGLRGFLDACRRHGWLPGLPSKASIHLHELPRRPQPPPRFAPEFVMAQLEDPASLARLPDETTRHLVIVLIETGLRANDACAFPEPDHRRQRRLGPPGRRAAHAGGLPRAARFAACSNCGEVTLTSRSHNVRTMTA